MREHPEPPCLQPGHRRPQHGHVLEHPAGQRHRREPVPVADGCASIFDQLNYPVLEARCHDRPARAARQVGRRFPHQVRPAHLERLTGDSWGEGGPVAAGFGGPGICASCGELLQLDRGLPLVVDRVAHPEQRGHRVEQAAGAGGERRVDPFPREREHVAPPVLVPLDDVQVSRPAAGERGVQVRRGHPPRLPDRGGTARHRDRREVPRPAELGQVGDQELTAPDRAVGAVPGPVERDPDDRAGLAVVGQAGGDVRVVVLDPRQVHPVQVQGVLGGQVLRVQVVGHHLGLDAEQPSVVLDTLRERAQCLGVLQVPDVMGQERPVPFGEAERVLQFGSAG